MTTTKKFALFLVLTLLGASILIMPAYGTTVESGSSIDYERGKYEDHHKCRVRCVGFHPGGDSTTTSVLRTSMVSPLRGKLPPSCEVPSRKGGEVPQTPFETIEFQERDSIDGRIYLFDKDMRYNSGWAR